MKFSKSRSRIRVRSSRYFGTRCQLRTPNQTLTPHSDRRTCPISSVATPARRIDADCPRTNVAGDPTIRSSPQLDPSVAPASQIRSAPRLEPSRVFRYSSRDFLVCGSSAFTTAALAGFTHRIYRFLRCADSRVKCRDVSPYRCAPLSWLCFCPDSLSSSKQGGRTVEYELGPGRIEHPQCRLLDE